MAQDKETKQQAALTAEQLAEWTPRRIWEARTALVVSRKSMEKATGLTGSVIWRSEQDIEEGSTRKGITDLQKAAIVDFLVRCQRDGVPEEYKRVGASGAHNRDSQVTKADLLERLERIAALLDQIMHAKTLREVRGLTEQARVFAKGDRDDSGNSDEPEDAESQT